MIWARLRRQSGKLSVRFVMLLALALLPLGIVSLAQTWSLKNEAQARTNAVLLGETLRAAAVEVGVLREVQGMVGVMASVVGTVVDDDAACIAVMRAAVARAPVSAVAGFVRKDGMMNCASTGQIYAFSDDPIFRQIVTEREPGFYVNRAGPVSGTSVLGLTHPVLRDGAYIGYVGMSLRHDRLIRLDAPGFSPDDPSGQQLLSFWTFDDAGQILTANVDLDSASQSLPAHRPLLSFVGGPPSVFRDESGTGAERTFALVPLIDGKLYLMSSWSLPETWWVRDATITPYLPTILMFTLGLIIAAYAAEHLVTRHIRVLRKSIGSFTRGDRQLPALDLRGAPEELHSVGTAYRAMTESVTRSETRLADIAHQKDVLLREVHHRVKNNLQLISSIMNIQLRRVQSEEAKTVLKGLQDRVISLATIHRELYQTSGLADVRADELFPDIVGQIISVSAASEQPSQVESDFDDLRLVPDQAIPLSLLLAEALSNALRQTDAAEPGRIRVRLKRLSGSQAVLEVTNRRSGPASYDAPASNQDALGSNNSPDVGSQLIAAFATQLSGDLETEHAADHFSLRLTFAVAPLAEAENSTQPVP